MVICKTAGIVKIALAGNPNTGKSTVFNELTGLKQHTGNWPGKTVVYKHGFYTLDGQKFLLVDLPGIYSLRTNSAEEEVAREMLCFQKPDVVIVMVDATSLERNLILLLQILSITSQVVVCLNFMDEARKKGIKIEIKKLAHLLGVPVVGTNARAGVGLDKLVKAVHEVAINKPVKVTGPLFEGRNSAVALVKNAEKISQTVLTFEKKDYQERDRQIDRLLTSKKFGIPLMLVLLGLIFWITIQGANYPSSVLMYLLSTVEKYLWLISLSLNMPIWLAEILILGVYRTLAWVVAVMLPPMAIFFPLFTLLEDLGYLPRIAFNLDAFFKKASAHGKQALTMCMGFGCNAAGVISCRIIDSPRERLIAILTNNFVPCNGRFPTLIALAVIFLVGNWPQPWDSWGAAFIITLALVSSLGITLIISWLLSRTILRGLPTGFILELPPYRRPQVGRVIVRSIFERTLFVLARAMVVAAPAGALIWLLANFTLADKSVLAHCAAFLDPFACLLGLDGYILLAFILGLPANEIVIPLLTMSYLATGSLLELNSLAALRELLLENGWTWLTAICMFIMVLNHFPCGTTLLTIRKETQSWLWTMAAFLIPTVVGLILCFFIAQSVRFLGV